ncbi:hypothetical protein ACJO5Y_07575 [Marinobacter sp. GN3S48]|uniref:hypothetical protein n=1 Tax=Marinobacter sp. GN3S48 TaxID=3382302 RepID=UPI00387B5C8C
MTLRKIFLVAIGLFFLSFGKAFASIDFLERFTYSPNLKGIKSYRTALYSSVDSIEREQLVDWRESVDQILRDEGLLEEEGGRSSPRITLWVEEVRHIRPLGLRYGIMIVEPRKNPRAKDGDKDPAILYVRTRITNLNKDEVLSNSEYFLKMMIKDLIDKHISSNRD